jgi:hypothetical protein
MTITSLDNLLIEKEYEKINNYLKERNIYKKSRLIIAEKYALSKEFLILSSLVGSIVIESSIYNYDPIYTPISFALYATGLGFGIWWTKRALAYTTISSIYIQKKNLKEIINESLKSFYSNNTEIKEGTVAGITLLRYSIVDYPVYIEKNNKNIEEIISKVAADDTLAHEILHIIIGKSDIKASGLAYLIYLDMNNFLDANDPYKYEKTKEIIRKNVKICVEYVKNEKRYDPYDIGRCYANITLHENDFSIDIKEEIEKLRHMKDKDIINKIKNYALNYSN